MSDQDFKQIQKAAGDLLEAMKRLERNDADASEHPLKQSVKAVVAEGIAKYAPDAKLTEGFIIPRVSQIIGQDAELAKRLINECIAEVMAERLKARFPGS